MAPKEKGRLRPSRGHGPARRIRGGSECDGSSGIFAHQVQQLLGRVPPAGHSHRLLTLWLERHTLEHRLELRHRVGGLIDRHPTCPRRVSLAVDRATLRIDSLDALLLHLAAAGERGGQ